MSQADKISSINEPGWDGVNANDQAMKVQNQKLQAELDKVFFETFKTEPGQKLMHYLRNRYLEQPCFVPNADPSYGYLREGQNSIIREIELRVRRANEPR